MNVEKHIKVTGSSKVSWKDAIVKTIEEASKTIDYLSSVKVLEQRAKINGNKISEYFVDLDLTFLNFITSKYAKLLYSQALLIEGFPIEDPVAYTNKVCQMMIDANK